MIDTPSPTPEEMAVVTIQVPGRKPFRLEGSIPQAYMHDLPWESLLGFIARGIERYAQLHTLQTTWREVDDGA